MSNGERFSERFGFVPSDREITIYQDAPRELRDATLAIAYEAGLRPSFLRGLICTVLRTRPDRENWSDGNVEEENRELVDSCQWYEVYEIIEKIYATAWERFFESGEGRGKDYFRDEINKFFQKSGVGWNLAEGQLQIRGEESFEVAVGHAKNALEASGRTTASNEIHQALSALSRRPEPDKTGAIQHAMAALECVARDVTGSKDTLGDIIKRNPSLIPKPLDQAVTMAWGFSSEHARHLLEGRELGMDEAQLVVGLSAVLITYISNKSACIAKEE